MFVVSAIVLLSAAGILGSVGTTIGVRIVPQFVQFQKFEVIVIIWLACSACADVIIATALVLHLVGGVVNRPFHTLRSLLQRDKKNGFPATDDLIDRVIRCKQSSFDWRGCAESTAKQ